MAMTHDEMIAVIQAHKEGKTIQCIPKNIPSAWSVTKSPCWNFERFDYRVESTPTQMPNINNLKIVRDRLLKLKQEGHEEQFNYSLWYEYNEPEDGPYLLPDEREETRSVKYLGHCGTCGCVAGWTCQVLFEGKYIPGSIHATAANLLNLDHRDKRFLFYCDGGYGFPNQNCEIEEVTLDDAIDRINALIDHYEKEPFKNYWDTINESSSTDQD